jgi:hypothetical protein
MKPRLAIARKANWVIHLNLLMRFLSPDPYAGETEDGHQAAHVVVLAHYESGDEADERQQQNQADDQKAMASHGSLRCWHWSGIRGSGHAITQNGIHFLLELCWRPVPHDSPDFFARRVSEHGLGHGELRPLDIAQVELGLAGIALHGHQLLVYV